MQWSTKRNPIHLHLLEPLAAPSPLTQKRWNILTQSSSSKCPVLSLNIVISYSRILIYASRIRTIANYAHEASRTYAFDLLPADTTWGLRPKFSKGASAAKTLCLRNSMDACVVWFVGRISKLWFYNQDHVPQSPVKVVIDPWSLGTTLKLRKKLKSLSQPQAGKH